MESNRWEFSRKISDLLPTLQITFKNPRQLLNWFLVYCFSYQVIIPLKTNIQLSANRTEAVYLIDLFCCITECRLAHGLAQAGSRWSSPGRSAMRSMSSVWSPMIIARWVYDAPCGTPRVPLNPGTLGYHWTLVPQGTVVPGVLCCGAPHCVHQK